MTNTAISSASAAPQLLPATLQPPKNATQAQSSTGSTGANSLANVQAAAGAEIAEASVKQAQARASSASGVGANIDVSA